MSLKEQLIAKFGKHINHMSCIYLNDGEKWLREYMKELPSLNTCIEIGTYQAVSSCILAQYFEIVYTIDIEKQKLTEPIIDFCKAKNISLNIIKNQKQKKDLIDTIFESKKVDLCFIDGEHFNGEFKKDFDLCKKSKYILVHDYEKSFPEVYSFCNSLKGYKKVIKGSFCLLVREGKKRGRKPKNNPLG